MRVLVSACLLGENYKYNGGNNLNQRVIDFLAEKEVVSICPEVLFGMTIPRPCAELVDGVVMDAEGNDVNEDYQNAALLALETIKSLDIDLVVLQSRSPTCGVNAVYDGSFSGKLQAGQGLFAKLLIDAGYTVIDAEDI